MESKITPARYIVEIFGGPTKTARALDLTVSGVNQWHHRKNKFVGSGIIPAQHFPLILKRAKELDLDITINDLVYGRTKIVKYIVAESED